MIEAANPTVCVVEENTNIPWTKASKIAGVSYSPLVVFHINLSLFRRHEEAFVHFVLNVTEVVKRYRFSEAPTVLDRNAKPTYYVVEENSTIAWTKASKIAQVFFSPLVVLTLISPTAFKSLDNICLVLVKLR